MGRPNNQNDSNSGNNQNIEAPLPPEDVPTGADFDISQNKEIKDMHDNITGENNNSSQNQDDGNTIENLFNNADEENIEQPPGIMPEPENKAQLQNQQQPQQMQQPEQENSISQLQQAPEPEQPEQTKAKEPEMQASTEQVQSQPVQPQQIQPQQTQTQYDTVFYESQNIQQPVQKQDKVPSKGSGLAQQTYGNQVKPMPAPVVDSTSSKDDVIPDNNQVSSSMKLQASDYASAKDVAEVKSLVKELINIFKHASDELKDDEFDQMRNAVAGLYRETKVIITALKDVSESVEYLDEKMQKGFADLTSVSAQENSPAPAESPEPEPMNSSQDIETQQYAQADNSQSPMPPLDTPDIPPAPSLAGADDPGNPDIPMPPSMQQPQETPGENPSGMQQEPNMNNMAQPPGVFSDNNDNSPDLPIQIPNTSGEAPSNSPMPPPSAKVPPPEKKKKGLFGLGGK
ncbi:MAG: hypothetical protein ACLFPQ_02525 [Candidatus Woesearchaeota archaeon]